MDGGPPGSEARHAVILHPHQGAAVGAAVAIGVTAEKSPQVVNNSGNVASELVYPYTTTDTDPNDVFVYFENEAGNADDREFSVIVMC